MNLRTLLTLVARESRGSRGRLGFVVACLAVGVAAVTAVNALVDGIQSSVRGDARALLAADIALEARRPLPPELFAYLEARADTTLARVTELSAMASAPAGSRLVELKAAEPGYPFHGALVTEPAGLLPGALAADEALAAPELLAGLELQVGDALSLGGNAYRVVGRVVDEPDRVDFALTLGPRLFLSPAGLARSGLVQFGSRVNHRVLIDLPGEPPVRELEAFVRDLRRGVADAESLTTKTAADPTPGLSRTLGRIEDFLGLVALLSLLLGGAGVAQIVRLWMDARTPAVAVLRAIGMRPREVALVYLTNLAALALVGCGIGAALGAAAPATVGRLLPELVPTGLPFPWRAALRGVALGLATAAGFALPPLTAVWRVPPARVLRAEATPLAAPRSVRIGSFVALFAVVLAAAYAQSDRGWTAFAFTAGVFLLAGALAGGALCAARLAGHLPRERFGPTLRHGLAALARPNSGTPAAAVALGAGVLVVVAMGLVSTRLRREFLAGIPKDAPSVFLVDVQFDQSSSVRALLDAHGATGVDRTAVVMARLGAVKGTPVAQLLAGSEGRSRWALSREQRLTFADVLPPSNALVAAAPAPGLPQNTLWRDPARTEVSLEARFAEDLGVSIGDTVTFDVQGVPLELVVTTLREVDWATFRINFFVVVEPGALDGAPGWELVAARVDAAQEDALQTALARAHPNVSVLRLRPLLEKVTAVVERVASAVQVLGGAVTLTGVAILAVAALATAARRAREAALLKALGVTRAGVARLMAVEHALVGALAGTLGGAGAWILAYGFLDAVLDLPGSPALWVVPAAAAAGMALALVAGSLATARARNVPPLVSLR
ncbi:MAG: FtsX-like permease family protein [Planctomycetota bacterium]